jgi:hypothetical protein
LHLKRVANPGLFKNVKILFGLHLKCEADSIISAPVNNMGDHGGLNQFAPGAGIRCFFAENTNAN